MTTTHVISSHAEIDARLLRMVAACVVKIDRDRNLLTRVAANVARQPNTRVRNRWQTLLKNPWPKLREKLLDESEAGAELRQDVPFSGLLTNAERLAFFRPPYPDAIPNVRREQYV